MIYEDVCLENVPLKRGRSEKLYTLQTTFSSLPPPHSRAILCLRQGVNEKWQKKPLKAEPWGRQVMCEWIFLRLRFFPF
jgi:hypothetical protein